MDVSTESSSDRLKQFQNVALPKNAEILLRTDRIVNVQVLRRMKENKEILTFVKREPALLYWSCYEADIADNLSSTVDKL